LMKHIAKLKKRPKYAFWKQVGSQAIQDIVDRIDKAYKLFFRNLEHGIKTAPPGFRKVKKYKSFTLKQAGWELLDSNKIRIGKHIYKFVKSRDIVGTIKTVTIKRNSKGEFCLYFSVIHEQPQVIATTGKIAGFDFGLKTFLMCSDGTEIESPQFLKQALNQLRKAQQQLSRKKKGSSRYRAWLYVVANLHEQVVNKRRDWFFKLAHELTSKFDYLFFETLNIKAMQRLWGRKITDLAFAEFIQILKYVAQQKGVIIHFVDRFFPSSKTCNCCGYINNELKLSGRHWRCNGCGNHNNRDHNAALNIECEGASSLGLGNVRQGSPAIAA
ncbi:MAG: transposase, partial [Chloroflexota bacterium]